VSKAGNITISVEGPYPCWCRIRHERSEDAVITLNHRELSDLKYACEKAMQEARLKLGDKANEV
jgi:hypothetical protein